MNDDSTAIETAAQLVAPRRFGTAVLYDASV